MLSAAARGLWKQPGFTSTAALTLALGIGATTAVFSVVKTVLLEPLPFQNPEELVMVWETHPEIPVLQVAAPDFRDWQTEAASFRELGAYTFEAINQAVLTGGGEPVEVQATMASENLLPLLGVEPIVGRGFLPSDELVALISHGLWVSRFGADPGITSKTITLGGRPHTVVGVMPAGAAFPTWADVWLPLSLLEEMVRDSRQFHPLEVVGRLRSGVTVAEAEAEVRGIARNLSRAHPQTNGKVGAIVVPLHSHLVAGARDLLVLLLAAVGIVLLVACVNVASLFSTRANARDKEFAVRAALGGSRPQLLRQLLTESMLLAGLGGALGVLIAIPIVPLLASLAPEAITRLRTPELDLTVLAFAGTATFVTALIFGTLPAWRASGCDLVAAMKTGASSRVTARGSRARDVLAVVETAMALVVLLGAGLLVKSFVRLQSVEPGFDGENVLTARVPLRSKKYTWEESARFYRDNLFPRLRALPGVEDVAVTSSAPLTLEPTERARFATRFGIVGRDHPPGQFPVAQTRWVSQDYFRVLGILLIQGRGLTRGDQDRQTVVINQTFAQRFFPVGKALGEQLLLGVMGPEPRPATIVGVVGDTREFGFDRPVEPTFYSVDISPVMTLLVRAKVEPLGLAGSVRAAMTAIDNDIPLGDVQTMEQLVSASVARRRFGTQLCSAFALVALVLAMVGVYGVISYSVARRTPELGLRMALGAGRREILGLVFGQGLRVTLGGITLGLVVSLATGRLIRSLLFGATETDAMVLAGVSGCVAVVSLVAVMIPAWRALRLEPTSALRYE